MLWLWISSLLLVNALPKYGTSTRMDVVAAARGLSTGFGNRLSKRQQAWEGYSPYYYYDTTGWPYLYSSLYYYPQYFDPYSTYYYPRPSTPPLREDLGPNPPYETPKSSYNPCADPNSVNWKVECNGGGSQKTTKIDGGAHSLQETNTFFTWKYGTKSPFNQPFESVGKPSLNGQFSSDSNNDNDNTNCVNGFDSLGNLCDNNNNNNNNNNNGGNSGGDCVNGFDSDGIACGGGNNNNNNGGLANTCINGVDLNGNSCTTGGGGNNNNNNGNNNNGGNSGGDCVNGLDSDGNACGGGNNNNNNGNNGNGRHGRKNGGNGGNSGNDNNDDDDSGTVSPNVNTATNVNAKVDPNIAVNLQR